LILRVNLGGCKQVYLIPVKSQQTLLKLAETFRPVRLDNFVRGDLRGLTAQVETFDNTKIL
jgi:hypothetical protein